MNTDNIDNIKKKLEKYSDPEVFTFNEEKHEYRIKGEKFTSVTQFLSKFHKPFEKDYWSEKKAKERGIEKEEILKEWQEINDRANFLGTSTHNWIENYFKKLYTELPTDLEVIERINKFNILYAKHLHKLTPISLEQKIFSENLKLAGMVDGLFLHKGDVYIIDYKTNKKFTDDSDKHFENLLPPFDDLPKNHLNEYSIQLSLYALILKEVDIYVKNMFLVYIPQKGQSKIIKAKNFIERLENYFSENNIKNKQR